MSAGPGAHAPERSAACQRGRGPGAPCGCGAPRALGPRPRSPAPCWVVEHRRGGEAAGPRHVPPSGRCRPGAFVSAEAASPPRAGGAQRSAAQGARILRAGRGRGRRPQAAALSPAEPRECAEPRGLGRLPNFSKSAHGPAGLGSELGREDPGDQQEDPEDQEEDPEEEGPPHQRRRLPAARGRAMRGGL